MRKRLYPWARWVSAITRGAFVMGVTLGACGGQNGRLSSVSTVPDVVTRPVGVPGSAFWFAAGDSVFWYEAADSLAVAQMRSGSAPEHISNVLYELRDMGWRMTVERGPALRKPGEPQSLSQPIYQLARANGAVSPVGERGAFAKRFWPDSQAALSGALLNILPGLRMYDTGRVEYFWPASVAIVWSPLSTAAQASAWLDSLGCTVTSSPQLVHQYFVQRAWIVELPAGAELFAWLRYFNHDGRVQLAHHVISMREPASVDSRLLRLLGKDFGEPETFSKLSADLKQAFQVARFSGRPDYAETSTRIPVDRGRLRLDIFTLKLSHADDSLLVGRYGGTLLDRSPSRIEAWIPVDSIPALAADTLVRRVEAQRSKLR